MGSQKCEGGKVGKWEIGDWRWEMGSRVEGRRSKVEGRREVKGGKVKGGKVEGRESRVEGLACPAVASQPLLQELKKTKVSR